MSSPEGPHDFPFDESVFANYRVNPLSGEIRHGDELLTPTERLIFGVTPDLVNILHDNMVRYDEPLTQSVHMLVGFAASMGALERACECIEHINRDGARSPYRPLTVIDDSQPAPEYLASVRRVDIRTVPTHLAAVELQMSEAGCTRDEALRYLLAKGNWIRRQLVAYDHRFLVRFNDGAMQIVSRAE